MFPHRTPLKDGNPYPSNLNHIDKSVRNELFTALSVQSSGLGLKYPVAIIVWSSAVGLARESHPTWE
jgi:hypothetical protein